MEPYGWWDRTRLNLITAPTVEPITLARAKKHLKIDISDDDDYITDLITVARQSVEQHCRRTLYKQRWKYTLQKFCNYIELPMAPCLSVISVKYYDSNNVEQTLASTVYRVFGGNGYPTDGAAITLDYNQSWPTVLNVDAAVNIEFWSGYTNGIINPIVDFSAASVEGDTLKLIPSPIKQAMLLWLGSMYANREDVIVGTISSILPGGVEALLAPNRYVRF